MCTKTVFPTFLPLQQAMSLAALFSEEMLGVLVWVGAMGAKLSLTIETATITAAVKPIW